MTIGGWARLDALPTAGLQYNVVSGRDNGASNWGQLEFDNEGGVPRLNVWSNNTGTVVVSGPIVEVGRWIYAVYSVSGTAWSLRYRYEGEATLTEFTGTGSSTVSAANLRFGREAVVDANTTLNGALHQQRVYTQLLTDAEALAESAASTPLVGTWAYYRFDDTATDTVDSSGEGRSLTYSAGSGSKADTQPPAQAIATGIYWDSAADLDRIEGRVFTQIAGVTSDATVEVDRHVLRVVTAGGSATLTNQRELYVLPETDGWEDFHAVLEVVNSRYSGSLGIKPQHGLGLRYNDDGSTRRAVMVWHDTAFGIPNAINLGVWQSNLSGGSFGNRQGNGRFDLLHEVTAASTSRTGGTVTVVTSVPHELLVDDLVNTSFTRTFAGVALDRSANVVTATLGSGHEMEVGDTVTLKNGGASSFDGTFTVTAVTGTTVSWSQTGSDESATGDVQDKSNDADQLAITEVVDDTTIRYVDDRHDLSTLGSGNVIRNFPYWIEAQLIGSVVTMRCWSRNQVPPAWDDAASGRLMVCDLDRAHTDFTVTDASRAGDVATLTIGSHDFVVGNRINVDLTDDTFDTGNGFVTAVTATTVSYANAGGDVASGPTGTCTLVGGGSTSAITGNPTPTGQGSLGVVAAHMGSDDDAAVRLGELSATGAPQADLAFVSGRISAAADLAGDLTVEASGVPVALDGAAGAVADAAGSIVVDRGLAGSVDVAAEAVGVVVRARTLDGAVDAAAALTGDAIVDRGLAGPVAAIGDAGGAVVIGQRLDGPVSAASAIGGGLDRARAIAGTVDVVGALSGVLDVTSDRVLEGSVDAAIALAGELDLAGVVDLAGSLDATAAAAGTLAVDATLAGSVDAVAAVRGTLTVPNLNAIDANVRVGPPILRGVAVIGPPRSRAAVAIAVARLAWAIAVARSRAQVAVGGPVHRDRAAVGAPRSRAQVGVGAVRSRAQVEVEPPRIERRD